MPLGTSNEGNRLEGKSGRARDGEVGEDGGTERGRESETYIFQRSVDIHGGRHDYLF